MGNTPVGLTDTDCSGSTRATRRDPLNESEHLGSQDPDFLPQRGYSLDARELQLDGEVEENLDFSSRSRGDAKEPFEVTLRAPAETLGHIGDDRHRGAPKL